MKLLFTLVALSLGSASAQSVDAFPRSINHGATLPTVCQVGSTYAVGTAVYVAASTGPCVWRELGAMTTLTASLIPGIVLDCNPVTGLKIGGGGATCDAATDDSAINAALAGAATSSPGGYVHLRVDGGFSTTGLVLPAAGHVWVECTTQGAGWWVRSGSNHDAVNNGIGYHPSGTPPAQGSGVRFTGGCYINGNRNGSVGDGRTSSPNFPLTNSTAPTDPGGNGAWLLCMSLANLDDVEIDGLTFYDCPTYAIIGNNVSHVRINGIKIRAPSGTLNTDGVHIDGPCSYISVTNSDIQAGDDAVAINLPEAYGGNCSYVNISGNSLISNEASGIKTYTLGYSMTGLYASNNTIGARTQCWTLGTAEVSPTLHTDQINGVFLSNSRCNSVYAALQIEENVSQLHMSHIYFAPNADFGAINNMNNRAWTVRDMSVDHFTIYHESFSCNGSGHWLISPNGGTITNLNISELRVVQRAGMTCTVPYLFDMSSGGTISSVTLSGMDWSNINALVNPLGGFTGITGIGGAALSQSLFNVTDAAAAKGVLYWSAGGGACTAGHMCVKDSGGTLHQIF